MENPEASTHNAQNIKDDPPINWPRIYFFILAYNAVLVAIFFLLRTIFNQD